jgi:sulfur-oxidizing protein SoxY
MKRPLIAVTAFLLLAGIVSALADDDAAERAARWREVASAIFGERTMEDGTGILKLTAPDSAMNAALVPITVELIGHRQIVAVSLVIDKNPSPLAGTFRLGPAFAQETLKMRVRVNEFTLVHAVAETDDGKLYSVSRYVKAAGGCSAPDAVASSDALARMGKMQLRRERSLNAALVPSQLLISHPNYSGMQQDPKTGDYTPARYLEKVSVTVGGTKAFDLESGISMSEDPAISFTYLARDGGTVDVKALDSSSTEFSQHFEALQ